MMVSSDKCRKKHVNYGAFGSTVFTCTKPTGHTGDHFDSLCGVPWKAWYPASDCETRLLDKYKPPYEARCEASEWTLRDAAGQIIMEAAEDSYGWTQPVRELADLLNELAERAGLI